MISSFSARDGLRVAGIDVPISATAIDAQGWTHCLHLLNSRKSLFEEVLIHRIGFHLARRVDDDARMRKVYNQKDYRS
jgi:hypothetical protein